jgi:hypothetical protein
MRRRSLACFRRCSLNQYWIAFFEESLASWVDLSYGMKYELPDAHECLSRQHVLPYARCFWHWELIDRLQF